MPNIGFAKNLCCKWFLIQEFFGWMSLEGQEATGCDRSSLQFRWYFIIYIKKGLVWVGEKLCMVERGRHCRQKNWILFTQMTEASVRGFSWKLKIFHVGPYIWIPMCLSRLRYKVWAYIRLQSFPHDMFGFILVKSNIGILTSGVLYTCLYPYKSICIF